MATRGHAPLVAYWWSYLLQAYSANWLSLEPRLHLRQSEDYQIILTNWGLVAPYGDPNLDQYWFRLWLFYWQHQTIALTHWGWETHIWVSKLNTIGSDNRLSPGRRQAIICASTGILLIRPLGTSLNEILIKIHKISLKKIHFKMLSGKWRPFCLASMC